MNTLNYLSDHGVDFTVRHHEEFFTALQEAASQHISGRMFAKTVVVKCGNDYLMLVLPASHRVALDRLREFLGDSVRMATEEEMLRLFRDCELGAEPPFGSQYGLRTLVDEHLAQQESIAVRPGNHREVVVLSYADFARLEAPQVLAFGDTAA